MYEILAGMDAYITDYSSACFEAAFAGIHVFLYADDVEAYTHDRGSLMWDMAAGDRRHIGNNRAVTPGVDGEREARRHRGGLAGEAIRAEGCRTEQASFLDVKHHDILSFYI